MAIEAEVEKTALVIPIEPLCCAGGNILNRMDDSPRDKYFVARFCDDVFVADDQAELAGDDGHEFVRRMDEIIPLSAGRSGEQVTGVASPSPVSGDLVSVGGVSRIYVGQD